MNDFSTWIGNFRIVTSFSQIQQNIIINLHFHFFIKEIIKFGI